MGDKESRSGFGERLYHFVTGNPTSRRYIVSVQSPLLFRVVGRNGKTNFPKGLTIWSQPIVQPLTSSPFVYSFPLIKRSTELVKFY